MFDWISQYSTNFSWISCRETEVFGAKTVLTPGRCHQGRKSHQRVRGWQGVHEFQEITLDIIDTIIGTYRKAAPHETTRVWILYVGVFLLPGSFQHLFLTRVVSTTYFLLKIRAHEIQYWLVAWNIIFFHILGIIIPTGLYFSEGWNHQREKNRLNQNVAPSTPGCSQTSPRTTPRSTSALDITYFGPIGTWKENPNLHFDTFWIIFDV